MKLVGWMLYRDQHQAVLEYLRRDQEIVPEFRDRLARWASEIGHGRTPDFQDKALLSENHDDDDEKRNAKSGHPRHD